MPTHTSIDRNPNATTVRRFGARTSIAAPVAGMVWFFIIRLTSGGWHPWAPVIIAGLGLSVGLSCLLAPARSRSLHVGWHIAIRCLDRIVTGILLGLVYFLVFTPLGLCFRLFGRQVIRRRPDSKAVSYWKTTEKATDLHRYHRQY